MDKDYFRNLTSNTVSLVYINFYNYANQIKRYNKRRTLREMNLIKYKINKYEVSYEVGNYYITRIKEAEFRV